MKERGKGAGRSVDERYTQWKSLVPVLYDWLANHNLVWPSLSCRFSPLLPPLSLSPRVSRPLLVRCLSLSFLAPLVSHCRRGSVDGAVFFTLSCLEFLPNLTWLLVVT